jgi:multisubunit Na+/H+ antiporter MnhC subunit
MTGSVYFIAIVAIGAVLAAVTGTIFLLIPFVLIAFAVVLVPVVWGYVRGTRLEPGVDEPHGVPTSREASYEPVQQPRQP